MNRELNIGSVTLRFDGEEVLRHEVGDEFIWKCPVTGTCFHMERMDDGHFWFRFDLRQKPEDKAIGWHCGIFQPEEGRLQLLVERDPDDGKVGMSGYINDWKKYQEEQK